MAGVVDVHLHVQPYRAMRPDLLAAMERDQVAHLGLLARIEKEPKLLLDHLDAIGVDRACLINYVAPEVIGYTRAVNDFVAEYQKADPRRLLGFGSVHPKHTKDVGRETRRLLGTLKLRGIKLHPPHQLFFANDYTSGRYPQLRKLYAQCQDAGVPVMIHTGTSVFPAARSKYGDPMQADDVAVDFPDLPIILAHGGRPIWCDTAFFLARRHRNVYIDVSSIPPRRLLSYFPRLAELDSKFLFGSDWPGPGVPGIREELEAIRALPLPAETIERLLIGNAQKLFQ